jgi:DNA-binding NarL/FixJ family response regulator
MSRREPLERYAPACEPGAAAVLSKQEPVEVLLKAIRQAAAMTHAGS